MRLLLSGGDELLEPRLRRTLAINHDLRTIDFSDLRDCNKVEDAVRDRDVVIQIVPSDDRLSDLDLLDSATRGTYNLLTTMMAGRLILVTSLRPFERYPASWQVTEQWAPKPTTAVADLAPYLAELTAREVSRVRPVEVSVLRLGEGVDAVGAVERALTFRPEPDDVSSRWHISHVPANGPIQAASTSGTPAQTAAPDAPPIRQPHNVVIYGAGGPLGAITAENLAHDHTLRLTDIRPLVEIAAGEPQSPGAPLPRGVLAPHEERRVDVSDPDQVMAATEGMDAIINCSVVRPDPVNAFRVNTLGAYNVARAAVAHGIRRIVHTGPVQFLLDHPSGYMADFDVSPDIPPRPGDNLYFVSKFLGQEICRIFAEEHGLSIPALLFGNFVNPAQPPDASAELYPFTVSWQDAAAAMRGALHVETLPRSFEVLHINADLPPGKYPNDKAKQLLGWQPRDQLANLWQRDHNADLTQGGE